MSAGSGPWDSPRQLPRTGIGALSCGFSHHSGSNTAVWPAGRAETFCTDSFRCRFIAEGPVDMCKLLEVAQRIAGAGIDVAVTETLRNFDGKAGFTLAQGQ